MNIKTLFKHFSLIEIENAIDQLKDLYEQKFKEQFHVISFTNVNGNVSYSIEKEYGFETTWRGNSGSLGKIRVVIPVEVYSLQLENDIRKKYDSYYNEWYANNFD